MSATVEPPVFAVGELWSLNDLDRLWKAPGETAQLRRRWVQRRIARWQVPSDGDRYDPRFVPAEVLRATQKHLGRSGK